MRPERERRLYFCGVETGRPATHKAAGATAWLKVFDCEPKRQTSQFIRAANGGRRRKGVGRTEKTPVILAELLRISGRR
jgi:hypothetical protein